MKVPQALHLTWTWCWKVQGLFALWQLEGNISCLLSFVSWHGEGFVYSITIILTICHLLTSYLRAAAPAADPGKMGKEETARLTFPICVCRVVYVCLYVYTLSSLCSLLYNIASLQTKKQTSRKNVFFPTFSAFSISISSPAAAAAQKHLPAPKQPLLMLLLLLLLTEE